MWETESSSSSPVSERSLISSKRYLALLTIQCPGIAPIQSTPEYFIVASGFKPCVTAC
ncbi:Uncharacterised protein [Vibrio cholerae]|nr:Uncharacterised protein [Vibrio cholerae]